MQPPNYSLNSQLVAVAILQIQPRNGTDYSGYETRLQREIIAVRIHQGLRPLEDR